MSAAARWLDRIGLLAAGLIAPEKILVAEPTESRRNFLQGQYGVACTMDAAALCSSCQVLVLAIKPQLAAAVLGQYSALLTERHLVISIMAGVTLQALAGCLNDSVRLIRAMPNTPALVLAAATAFVPINGPLSRTVTSPPPFFPRWAPARKCLKASWTRSPASAAAAPVTCSPLSEAMIDGGVLAGLPRPTAEQLVLQTVYGSAKLALETGDHPAVLKGKVTSPGGTTIAGIQVLEDGALRGVVMEAIRAATERSRELGA